MARRRFVFRTLICAVCHTPTTALMEDGVAAICRRDSGHPAGMLCGGLLVRPDPTAPLSPTVFDDQLWGGPRWLENVAPQPIYCETKSEYRALLAAHGMAERVRHMPTPGSDKSPHTTRWDVGLPPGVDARPFAMLTPPEQTHRRQEAAERFGWTVDELVAMGANLESTGVDLPSGPDSSCEFIPDRG